MHYRKFPPPIDLAPFVDCYFEWEGNALERTEVQTPPSARGAVVFNYGDPTTAYQHREPEQPVPDAFVCGLFTSNFRRVLHGRIGMFGIVFHAGSLHNLFGLRMSNLVNSRMPLDFLVGERATLLLKSVKEAPDGNQRSEIASEWLRPFIAEGQQRISIIDDAIDFVVSKDGMVTIEEVAEHFKISKRYLEKQFLIKVGVSPKFFARLRRFAKLSLKVAYSDSVDWMSLATEAGFHDQSHMVKEFLEFNGQTPADYLENHLEMTRFVKKKE